MIRATLIGLLLSFSSHLVVALPLPSTIAHRVAVNAGRGSFVVEQDVTLEAGTAEPIRFHESWTIESTQYMRVDVAFPDAGRKRWSAVYSGDQRLAPAYSDDPGAAVRLERGALPPEWTQSWLVVRSTKQFLAFMVAIGAIPASALKSTSRGAAATDAPRAFDWLTLARGGGAIHWAFGLPSRSGTIAPAVWVEQDEFVIRRVRWKTGAALDTEELSDIGNGILFPAKTKISFDFAGVRATASSVRTGVKILDNGKGPAAQRHRLPAIEPQQVAPLSSQPLVREFFSRFR